MINFFTKNPSLNTFEAEIENKDLLFISYETNIPSYQRGLIFKIEIDEFGRVQVNSSKNEIYDPSTIFVNLPIRKPISDVPQLPYYPNYIDLLPEQRYIYLDWLRNVNNQIDTGFVFLYYYGLERNLLVGDFDKAFNQIIRLRNIHQNKSFLNYTETALIHACIMRDKVDHLLNLNEKTDISGFSNAQFLLAFNLGMDLSSENLLSIFKRNINLSKKPIKEDYQIMNRHVSAALEFKYGNQAFPFAKKYDISKVKTKRESRFANYSFSDDIRFVDITDFYAHKVLMTDIESIFSLAYENYKKERTNQRKVGKGNLTPVQVEIKQIESDIRRYCKLLKDKKITQIEFEVLSQRANELLDKAKSDIQMSVGIGSVYDFENLLNEVKK